MPEMQESEFHSCICSKLEKLTLAEELGQSWKSILVCISFRDYKKSFKIHKKDLPLLNEIGNAPENAVNQVERILEEPKEDSRIQIVDVRSMTIPISPTTINQLLNSNDHVTTTEVDIKSEINETELEFPTPSPVSLLSTNSSFKIDTTKLSSLPTETGNVAGNQVEQDLEEPEGQNNDDKQSESVVNIPIVSSSSNQDSDGPSVHLNTTGRKSRQKRKRKDLDSELEPNVSPLPTHSKSRPNIEPLSNETTTSTTNNINQCRTCSKQFSTKYSLNQHKKRMHSDEQSKTNWKHESDICYKKFLYLNILNQHKFVHSEQRKFKCSECPATYKWKKHLVTHSKTHEKKRFAL